MLDLELRKAGVTLRLLHHEYLEQTSRFLKVSLYTGTGVVPAPGIVIAGAVKPPA